MLKFLLALIILLVWGDALSTYLVLTQVPGGEEVNPIALYFIHLYGPGAAMTISATFRTLGAVWLHYMAASKEVMKTFITLGFFVMALATLAANINNWLIYVGNS